MKGKRLALLIAACMLALASIAIVGCSNAPASTPSGSVSAALDALKAQDETELAKYYDGDTSNVDDLQSALSSTDNSTLNMFSDTAENLTDEQKKTVEDLAKKMLDFDYSVSNESIDGDKATVDVTITTYDFGTMMTNFLGEYMTQAFATAFSGSVDEAAYQEQAFKTLQNSLDTIGDKGQTATATVSLTKGEDGTWKVDDLTENEAFIDAILGGMISSISDSLSSLASAFGGAETDTSK